MNSLKIILIDSLAFVILIGLAAITFHESWNSEDNLAFSFSNDNIVFISSGTVSDFLSYDDIISGFSIKYPSNWQLEQHIDKSVTFIAPRESNLDSFPAGLGIMSKKISSNLSMVAITQKQLSTLKSLYPDIRILESIDTTFLGHPAHKLTFTATDNTQTLRKAMQLWFKADTRTYLITYKASDEKFSNFLPIVERMLNSFYVYDTS